LAELLPWCSALKIKATKSQNGVVFVIAAKPTGHRELISGLGKLSHVDAGTGNRQEKEPPNME